MKFYQDVIIYIISYVNIPNLMISFNTNAYHICLFMEMYFQSALIGESHERCFAY